MAKTQESFPAPQPGQYEIPDKPGLAVEKFWSLWGEQAGFSREQFELLWTDAGNQYIDELPHHNFRHAQESLWDTMCLADYAESRGLTVNRKALAGAALFHDAGFHQDFMQAQFSSKEEYSAVIFAARAPHYGLTPDDIAVGRQAIQSTNLGGVPVSIEDKIMVRADMMNVSGDYETSFSPTTKRIMAEVQMGEQSGRLIDRIGFRRDSLKIIAGYLVHDLSLWPGESREWLKKPVSNLYRFAAETAQEEHLTVREFVRQLGSSAVTRLLGEHDSDNTDN